MTATIVSQEWAYSGASLSTGIDAALWGDTIDGNSVPWAVMQYTTTTGSYLQAFRRDTLQMGTPLVLGTGHLFSAPYLPFAWTKQSNCVYSGDHLLMTFGTFDGSGGQPSDLRGFKVNADLSISQLWTATVPTVSGATQGAIALAEMPAYPGHVLFSVYDLVPAVGGGSTITTRWYGFDTSTQSFTDFGHATGLAYVNILYDYGHATNLLATTAMSTNTYCVVAPTPTGVTEVGPWTYSGDGNMQSEVTLDYTALTPGSVMLLADSATSTAAPGWFGVAEVTVSGGTITFTNQFHLFDQTPYAGASTSFTYDEPLGGMFRNGAGVIGLFGWEPDLARNDVLVVSYDGSSWSQDWIYALDWWTNTEYGDHVVAWPGAAPNQIVFGAETYPSDGVVTPAHPSGAIKVAIISTTPQPNLAATVGASRARFRRTR